MVQRLRRIRESGRSELLPEIIDFQSGVCLCVHTCVRVYKCDVRVRVQVHVCMCMCAQRSVYVLMCVCMCMPLPLALASYMWDDS